MINSSKSVLQWLTAIPFFQISTLALLVAYFIYKYTTYHYGKWKKLGVPHAEPTPVLGNVGPFIMARQPLYQVIQSLYDRFDGQPYFGLFEGRLPVLVVRDPNLVHTVMVNDFTHFYDRLKDKVGFKAEKLFDHLFNLRGEQWKSIRAKLSPTFSAAKLKSMLSDINDCTERLMVNLNQQIRTKNGIVDVSESSAQFTTDTIGRCAFGLECNALADSDSEFRRAGRDTFALTIKRTVLNFFRLVGFGRLLDVFGAYALPLHVNEFFYNLVKTTMNQHESEENIRKDFISLLVKVKHEEQQNNHGPKLFTDMILASNAFVFFVAGFETTASTISYCLYELARNPEIQDGLREKINQTLNENEGKLSYDTLKEMKYLDMVINETLRIHPPVPVLNRVCTKDYTIPDTDINVHVGDKLIIPIYALHHDPKYYPNPEVFDPERFTEENKASRPNGTFIPFGDGPRICIGMRFAIMEIKTGLSEIISKFEVKVCKDTQIPIEIDPKSFLLLTPKKSIRLELTNIE